MTQNLKQYDGSMVIAGRKATWALGTLHVTQDGELIAAYDLPADEVNAYAYDLMVAAQA